MPWSIRRTRRWRASSSRVTPPTAPALPALHGWVGWKPNIYLPSVRTPGATVHLDPDVYSGYTASRHRRPQHDHRPVARRRRHGHESTRPHWRLRHAGLQHGSGRQLVPDGLHAQRRRHQRRPDLQAHALRALLPGHLDAKQLGRRRAPLTTSYSARGPRRTRGTAKNSAGAFVSDGRFDITITPRIAPGTSAPPRRSA